VAEAHGAATYGIRPEHIALSHDAGDWTGRVILTERLGSDTFVHVDVEGVGPVNVRVEGRSDRAPHARSGGHSPLRCGGRPVRATTPA
jgi:multiple sugar transport system ATP-binding protein